MRIYIPSNEVEDYSENWTAGTVMKVLSMLSCFL